MNLAPVEPSGELVQEIHHIWYWNELETILDLAVIKDVVQRQQLLADVFQNLRLVYISCKYFRFEKNIPFSIFSGGHIVKGFDRQTWWFVNFTHFSMSDYF